MACSSEGIVVCYSWFLLVKSAKICSYISIYFRLLDLTCCKLSWYISYFRTQGNNVTQFRMSNVTLQHSGAEMKCVSVTRTVTEPRLLTRRNAGLNMTMNTPPSSNNVSLFKMRSVRMFHQSNVMSSMLEGSKTGVQGKFEVISCIYFFYFTIWYLYLSSISRFGWYSILSWWVLIWYLLLVLICNMIEILILTFLNSIQSNLILWAILDGK